MAKKNDSGREIWWVEYYDHAFHVGDPKEALKFPYKLWAVGVVEEENKDFIMLRNAGSTSHEKYYTNDAYEMIMKKVILNRKMLGVIGEDIELS